jgi:myo-inositol-1(or 4)-monophosphatase
MTGVTSARELLVIAVGAALEAGQVLASKAGRVSVAATKSSPTDVVTEMDGRAEELIRARILVARPDDAILGEEGGQVDGAAGAPARWVVDPLDGTVNYLYGLHDWAVSIAAEVDLGAADGDVGSRAAGGDVERAADGDVGSRAAGGDVGRQIVAGAVYVPMRGELFTAVRGEGAWLESTRGSGTSGAPGESVIPDSTFERIPLRCRPGVPLDQALVATGFGYRAERRTVQGEVVAALLPRIRDIRRNGVASVDLCAVAAGRLDGYYERGLNYWDYAAGALIAAEAGAVVGDSRGGPPSTSMTVAAGPGLFGPLRDALAELDAERDG